MSPSYSCPESASRLEIAVHLPLLHLLCSCFSSSLSLHFFCEPGKVNLMCMLTSLYASSICIHMLRVHHIMLIYSLLSCPFSSQISLFLWHSHQKPCEQACWSLRLCGPGLVRMPGLIIPYVLSAHHSAPASHAFFLFLQKEFIPSR